MQMKIKHFIYIFKKSGFVSKWTRKIAQQVDFIPI